MAPAAPGGDHPPYLIFGLCWCGAGVAGVLIEADGVCGCVLRGVFVEERDTKLASASPEIVADGHCVLILFVMRKDWTKPLRRVSGSFALFVAFFCYSCCCLFALLLRSRFVALLGGHTRHHHRHAPCLPTPHARTPPFVFISRSFTPFIRKFFLLPVSIDMETPHGASPQNILGLLSIKIKNKREQKLKLCKSMGASVVVVVVLPRSRKM